MRKALYLYFILPLILLLQVNVNYAAFPANATPTQAAVAVAEAPAKTFLKTPFKKTDAVSANDEPGYAIASFICGLISFPVTILGLLLLIFGGAFGMFIVGGILAIAAVVLGALGFNKAYKGLAIAGFVIGLISVLYFIPVLVGVAGV